ncbi:MAG TPA: aromatic amino acid lyase [Acidimicrobiales bacterium]|nr:aromatic amino acid lyase [Acidimicrobiales bacterium]
MTVLVDTRDDFTLENFRRVAVDGESVEIGPVARRAMAEARAAFVSLLDADRTAFFYGITTRAGLEVTVTIPPEDQLAFARSFSGRSGRGFGGGFLDERVVRGIVFARLADFVEGNAKVRPIVAERVAALLDLPLPLVPLDGQVGAGEVLPMRHVTMGLSDLELEEGEGMALINGSPASSALLADTALHARHRLSHAEKFFALSIEAIRAPLDAYDEALESLWGDAQETAALRALRGHLASAETENRLGHQAPVSYRIVPRVLGQARRAVEGVERAAAVALRSVTQNPVYVPPDEDHPRGRVLSTGGYHNAAAPAALGMLALAWAELALLAERQVTAMHLSSVSGLPHFLNPRGFEPDSAGGATNLFGWVAGSFVEEARAAAAPTLLPASINDPQNDVSSATFSAYRKERRAAECLDDALAILALVSSQALYVTERRPAPPLEPLLQAVRSLFAPVDGTVVRDQGVEAGRLARVISKGALSGALAFEDLGE